MIFDKASFIKSFNIIADDFINDNCIANKNITEIPDMIANILYSKIIFASGGYNPQQIILMFLYVFILFDGIFNREAIASVAQLTPERKTDKADQFYVITHRSEKLRNLLLSFLIYKGVKFDEPNIIDLGIDDIVIDGIALMLTACEACYKHINGDNMDSEYVNRAVLSDILTKLEKIIVVEFGIPLPDEYTITDYTKMYTSRFGLEYLRFKEIYKSLKPPRKPKPQNNSIQWGFVFPMK